MLTDDHPLALGDPRLDQDHDALNRLVVAFGRTVGDAGAARDALAALRAQAGEHFAFEDGELRALGGPDMQCHLDEHQAVLRSLDEVHALLAASDTAADTAARLVVTLAAELQRWLPEHVSYMDVAVAKARVQARLGGAAVRLSRRGPAPGGSA